MRPTPHWLHSLLLAAALLASHPAAAVLVGSPGNAADASGYGAVAHAYGIGQFEVTNGEYAAFLSAVAADDVHGLWTAGMAGPWGGIERTGAPGSHGYAVKPGFASKPVTFVSFYDALRYANWIANGSPSGAQDATTTEDGSYTITAQAITDNAIARNAGATIVLPNEDEWVKAAYYDATVGAYHDHPAGVDAAPTCAAAGATANTANCGSAVDGLTDVGAYAGSASPWGTFDQGGNVAEWLEPGEGESRLTRGGNWSEGSGELAAADRNPITPSNENRVTGFRIAITPLPEPGLGATLAAGLAALLALSRARIRARRTALSALVVGALAFAPETARAQFGGSELDPASTGGQWYDIVLTAQHPAPDGEPAEDIAITVFEPAVIDPAAKHALVLNGHGFALTRARFPNGWTPECQGECPGSVAVDVHRFIDAGFWVISIDQRGHGDSGGDVRLMDPDHEGLNLLQILDWAEANLPHLLYRDGNLVAGATGGSYGGGYQLLTWAIDDKRRLDSLVPQITWHSMLEALAPQGVAKSGWGTGLVAASSASTGGSIDPFIYEEFQQAAADNELSPEFQDFLTYHGTKYWCDGVTTPGTTDEGLPFRTAKTPPPIDALIVQGMHDTLLPLTEAEGNFDCLNALGGDVRLYTYQFSHATPSGLGMSSPPPFENTSCSGFDCLALFQYYFEQYSDVSGASSSDYQYSCGPYGIPELEVTWTRAKLQRDASAIAALEAAPQTCINLGAQPDAVTADGVTPPPPVSASVPETVITVSGSEHAPVVFPLVVLDEASVLLGRPQATITLSPTAADPLGTGDPIVFLALGRGRASYDHYCHEYADPWPFAPQAFCFPIEATVGDVTTPAYLEVVDDQITPIRGYGTHVVDLSSVGERLGAGEVLELFVFGYHYAYYATSNRAPVVVTIEGRVELPLHADLPPLTVEP